MLQADLNERAAEAMERAMKAMGLRHATELSSRLRLVVTDGPSPTTCLRWIKREQAIPAWALLAAAEAAQMTVDALLGQMETRRLLNALAEIEHRLEVLEAREDSGSA